MMPDMKNMLASLARVQSVELAKWSRSARNIICGLEQRGYVEYIEGGTAVAITQAGRDTVTT